MRIEPNVSLRKSGEKALPDYKVELKNINSFKFAEGAINYELERQTKALEKGERLIQETRGWNEKENKTVSQRFKEEAHDYRYFPEPDLPPLSFNTRHLSNIKRNIPEMPDVKLERFKKQYNFASYDAQILTSDKIIADFFEETLKAYKKDDPKRVANWIIGELLRRLRENGKSLKYIDLLPANLAELLYLADTAEITQNIAKEVFAKMLETGKTAQSIIKSMGLTKMSVEDLEVLINKILKENKKAVNDFRKGKEASIGFLIGQVQKEAKGQADANLTRRLLLEKLK